MKIKLLSMRLVYFKGIRDFSVPFDQTTNIFGENGTGKTTLFDAFTWLLFGKDSQDRKDFEIKTLDANNVAIPQIDHEVSAVLDINGTQVSLRRVFKEKWTKKKGNPEAEFNGNETNFFWNEVPMQAGEYQAKISELLDEKLFKLITNVMQFNSMEWKNRRTVLMELAGKITDEDILACAGSNEQHQGFQDLLKMLNEGETMDDLRKRTVAKKNLLKRELEGIPTRIDEANRTMPDPVDADALTKEKNAAQVRIDQIDATLQDATKALDEHHKEINAKQEQLQSLRLKLNDRTHQIKNNFLEQTRERSSKAAAAAGKVRSIDSDITLNREEYVRQNNRLVQFQDRETRLTKTLDQLRSDWKVIDASTLEFRDDQFVCPSCLRELPQENIETQKEKLEENFKSDKSRRLEIIDRDGQNLKKELEQVHADINTVRQEMTRLDDAKKALEADRIKSSDELQGINEKNIAANTDQQVEEMKMINTDPEAESIRTDISALEALIAESRETVTPSNPAFQTEKKELLLKIEQINNQLGRTEQIQKVQDRIKELKENERKLANEIAGMERTEYSADQFEKLRMNILDARINERFTMVNFRLFRTQINGGVDECCDALINGVPFTDANNAAKINAGLDIINTLCDHHQVYAPIFIDNRESVNKLIDSKSQIINLVVTTDKSLRVA